MSMVSRYPFVPMFIWFVYQDTQGAAVGVGHLHARRQPEGARPRRGSPRARGRSTRATGLSSSRAARSRRSSTSTRAATARTAASGTPIGMTWRVFRGGTAHQRRSADRAAPKRLHDRRAASESRAESRAAQTYTVTFAMNNASGVVLNRRITLRGSVVALSRPRRAPASPPTTGGHRVTCRRS